MTRTETTLLFVTAAIIICAAHMSLMRYIGHMPASYDIKLTNIATPTVEPVSDTVRDATVWKLLEGL